MTKVAKPIAKVEEANTPVKKINGAKSEAQSRAEEIAKKFENFSFLKKKVNARNQFQKKLDELEQAENQIGKTEGEDWEAESPVRVSMELERRQILTFSKVDVVKEFLDFMRERIEKKVSSLDDEILKLTV